MGALGVARVTHTEAGRQTLLFIHGVTLGRGKSTITKANPSWCISQKPGQW